VPPSSARRGGVLGQVNPVDMTKQAVRYNPQYMGPSYSVKYLGIVDGTMGILSRKMAL